MSPIKKRPVPENTLLSKYLMNGAYADCYVTVIPRRISFPDFVFNFYTTPLFKLERLILKFTVSKPSTDAQARQIADSGIEKFAAWSVEDRKENELLMCDFIGRTRSWFMVVSVDETQTQLYFGSAVSSREDPKTGKHSLGFIFQALLGFHQTYSTLLLYSARSKIMRKKES